MMNKRLACTVVAAAALGLLIAACVPTLTPMPPPVGMVCESLDGLILGSKIKVLAPPSGTSFPTPLLELVARPFMRGNGTMNSDGFAVVDDQGRAGGSGYDVNASNVLLAVHTGPGQTLQELQLTFGAHGANYNVSINNQLVNFGDFATIAGTTIGGVKVDLLNMAPGNKLGQIVFVGPMHDQTGGLGQFSIGGAELWIDDICFSQ